MPTKHKRHSVTETPRVKAALDELRSARPGERIDLAELVILGARRKAQEQEISNDERRRRIDALVERVRTGNTGVDPQAAQRVRREGWNRSL